MKEDLRRELRDMRLIATAVCIVVGVLSVLITVLLIITIFVHKSPLWVVILLVGIAGVIYSMLRGAINDLKAIKTAWNETESKA